MVIEMSTLPHALPKHPANSVPHMQASNIMFHPNMTHAQMVAWKHEHLDGRKLVMRPEPKEVA